jgi:hypothetical protein
MMTKRSSGERIVIPSALPTAHSLVRGSEAAKLVPNMACSKSTLGPLGSSERKQRILVADDNADMCEYLDFILRPHWEV